MRSVAKDYVAALIIRGDEFGEVFQAVGQAVLDRGLADPVHGLHADGLHDARIIDQGETDLSLILARGRMSDHIHEPVQDGLIHGVRQIAAH